MPRPRTLALRAALVAALLAAAPGRAAAADLVITPLAGQQGAFRDLSRELGLALADYQMRPAAPLGFLRFDAGVEASAVDIHQDRDYWKAALRDANPPSFLPVPRAHVNVGLPLGIDLGGVYSFVPDLDVRMWGGEVKWSVIRGGVLWPAVAVRGAYTALDGVDELDLTTKSADASISKGFGPVTPYVGVGRVWIEADPKGAAAALGLTKVKPVEDRAFAGLRLRMLILSAVAEASFAQTPAYTLRLNVSF